MLLNVSNCWGLSFFLFFSNSFLAVSRTGLHSTYGAHLVKFRNMDTTSAHDQLGPGDFSDVGYRPSTGFQPIWTFTEGTTGPVSRSVPERTAERRMRKWSIAPAKLVRRQDRQCKHIASCGPAHSGYFQISPLDQTQDLLNALAGITTEDGNIIMRDMPLSLSEAAIFVHLELEASRQNIWAQMLNLCHVDCVVSSQVSTGQCVCTNGFMLQVSCAMPDTFC